MFIPVGNRLFLLAYNFRVTATWEKIFKLRWNWKCHYLGEKIWHYQQHSKWPNHFSKFYQPVRKPSSFTPPLPTRSWNVPHSASGFIAIENSHPLKCTKLSLPLLIPTKPIPRLGLRCWHAYPVCISTAWRHSFTIIWCLENELQIIKVAWKWVEIPESWALLTP